MKLYRIIFFLLTVICNLAFGQVGCNPPPVANAGKDQTVCGIPAKLEATGGTTYSWSTGEKTSSINVLPSETKVYTVTVTLNGCTASDDVKITKESPPYTNAGPDQTIKNGTSTVLTVTGEGTYLWSDNNQTNKIISVSPNITSTYFVTVTKLGCTNSDAVVVTVIQDPNIVNVDAGDDVTICKGSSVQLKASGADSYSWENGAKTETTTVSPNSTYMYQVTGTKNGATNTDYVKVTVVDNPIPKINGPNIVCSIDSVQLNAGVYKKYKWSNGHFSNPVYANTALSTSYSVTVTDYNGCTGTDAFNIQVISKVDADAGPNVGIIKGNTITLSATGGLTYSWSTALIGQDLTVSPDTTTTYYVTVSVQGCSATDYVIVYVNEPSEFVNILVGGGSSSTPMDSDDSTGMCNGDNIILTAANAESYIWSNGYTSSTISVSPSVTTAYYVTGYNSGVPSFDTIVVVAIGPNVDAGEDQTISKGETATLKATGADTYSWSTGQKAETINVNPEQTTTYLVDGTTKGCTARDAVIITVFGSVKANDDFSICANNPTYLIASNAESYSWSTGEVNDTIIITPIINSTYIVTGTTQGATSIDSVIVKVNWVPDLKIANNSTTGDTICGGNSIILSASGANVYSWNTKQKLVKISVSPDTTTEYIVMGSNYVCVTYAHKIITVISVDAGIDQTICEAGNVTLSASYNWDNISWSTNETTKTINVSPTSTTKYYAYTNYNGCTTVDSVTVNVVNPPKANAGNDLTICQGTNAYLYAHGGASYFWNTNSNDSLLVVSPSVKTTYILTAYGQYSGCFDIDTVTVNIVPINADAGNDVTINQGESTIITASGGGIYSWDFGSTKATEDVSPTTTTVYKVAVIKDGCTDIDEVIVYVVNDYTEAFFDDTICQGDTTIIKAIGATTYSWSNGAKTNFIKVSPSITTTYIVTGTKAGKKTIDSVVIFVNPIPSVEIIAGTSTICSQSGTTLTAQGANTYIWDVGSINSSIFIKPSTSTAYSVVGTNNYGCTNKADITINVGSIPTANAGPDQTVCNAYRIALKASGGNSYSWDNGAKTDTTSVIPTTKTTYTVTVSINGCSAIDNVVIFVNPSPNANAGIDQTICNGTKITLKATGGSSYTWSNGAKNDTTSVTPTKTSKYTVTTEQNGCSAKDDIIITVNSTPIADAGIDVTVCKGEYTTLKTTGAASYSWSNGKTDSIITVNPNSTTNYYLTAYNGSCNDKDTVVVTVSNSITTNAGIDQTICKGSTTKLSAPSGANKYKWSTNDTIQSINVKPNATKTYFLTMSIGNCTGTDDVIVTVNPIPTANAGNNQTICNGSSTYIKATGPTGSTFLWSNGSSSDSIEVAPVYTSTYILTVINQGCSASDNVVISIIDIPEKLISKQYSICKGDSFKLKLDSIYTYSWDNLYTGNIFSIKPNQTETHILTSINNFGCERTDTFKIIVKNLPTSSLDDTIRACKNQNLLLTANGGDLYKWDTGENTQSITITPSINKFWKVTISLNSCYIIDSVFIPLTYINIEISGQKYYSICYGDTANVKIDANASVFEWSNKENGKQIIVSPISSTTYTITATNDVCTAKEDIIVNVNNKIITNDVVKHIDCKGNNNGSIQIIHDTENNYTFSWSNNQTSTVINNLSAGNYTLTVKDTNNCSITINYTITQPDELMSTITTYNATCSNICNGIISVKTKGGITPYKYVWSNNEFTADVYNICAGNYTFTVYDNNACSKQYTANVKEKHTLTIDITTENIKCYNGNNGKIKLTTNGGIPEYQYIWEDGTEGNQREELSSGFYPFSVYDNNGCKKDSIAIITKPDTMQIEFTGIKEPACFNDCNGKIKANIKGGTAPYQYVWSNNANTDNITNLCAGIYSLTIKDNNNCFASSYLMFNNPTPMSIIATSTNANCIGACDGTASVNILGGNAPYSYQWSNGDENPTTTNLCPGKYHVTANDSRNCNINSSVEVNTNSSIPDIHITADNDTIVKGNSTNLHLIQSKLYSYIWTNDNELNQNDIFNPSATPSQSKYFYAIITDEYNCSFIDSILINIIEPTCDDPYIFIPNTFTPNGDNQNDVLYLRGVNIRDFHLSIFDRWGEKVFETYDQSIGWNGTYNGKLLDPAVFKYYLELTCPDGYQFFKKGNITLIR
ncbi:MAG: hypothetical protein A2X12_00695 [Bacteroidetes bacterium GWE2_29_8]|nr:MAG: hypothetical protein A2X12_00695 [Bacteroidetes bacterium GWE2_29_8]OFY21928.1 MAG: hypothetical protein A2X02_01550 [Bacteroidetes bacterium GWF2_29_10]